ncbi:MAG: MATE family efflux transporter [Halanaerobiales bacterium]|jgi:putative MATE family efflux protein|nr:MATE family efflux transporter [Halanaerobiales bacterium]HPZ62191.1 MATE family efflux transporter [Halanaerobiales bacterium]HQD03863.1 MATE family efflux transporter [Halanaerobiales bacterium]
MGTKKLHQLAIPILIESLLFMLLGVADIFMLSNYSDWAAGAVGAANQFIGNMHLLFAIVSTGTAVLVAQNVGARRYKAVEKVASVALVLNFFLGLIIGLTMIFFGNSILEKMGVTADLMAYASQYLTIVGGALFFQAILNTVTAIIRSHGHTRQTMYITVLMNIINILGDVLLIFGLFGFPELGVKGAAIATAFSKIIATIIALIFMFKKILPLKMFLSLKEKPLNELGGLIKIGFPSAMESMCYSLSQTAIMSIILINLGDNAYIARTYVMTIARFVMIFFNSIGQASQIMIGQLIGAARIEEAYETGLRNFKTAMFFTVLASSGMAILSRYLIRIFTDDPVIIKIAVPVMIVDAFLEAGRAFNVVLINNLRGAGDVIFPVMMAMFSMWLFGVLGGYVFGVTLGYGLIGIWVGNLLDEWLRGISMYFRWKGRKWTEKLVVAKID